MSLFDRLTDCATQHADDTRLLSQMQMVIPESDQSTLDKVDASAFNVTTYKAAFTKQVKTAGSGPHTFPACVHNI